MAVGRPCPSDPFYGRALTAFEKPKTERSTHPGTSSEPAPGEHARLWCWLARTPVPKDCRNPQSPPSGPMRTVAKADEHRHVSRDPAGRGTLRTGLHAKP